MFFEIIAGIFLVIFFIKLLDPFILPGLKRLGRFIRQGINYVIENFGSILYQGIKFFFLIFSILVESLFRGIKSLFTDTVKVLGIIIIAAILLDIIITTIAYPMIYNFNNWFSIFIKSFFSVYTFTFTSGVYLYGLYDRMRSPSKRFIYVSKGMGNIEDFFKHAYHAHSKQRNTLGRKQNKNQEKSKKTVYVYDEQEDEYKQNN